MQLYLSIDPDGNCPPFGEYCYHTREKGQGECLTAKIGVWGHFVFLAAGGSVLADLEELTRKVATYSYQHPHTSQPPPHK